jgi:hypothetical protein
MTNDELKKLQYPIGGFVSPEEVGKENISNWIEVIEFYPQKIKDLVCELTEVQLDTPYRPDGWTVRQLLHHLPDSHLNSYVRLKWTLTEDTPTIKAYHEDRWAELPDSKGDISLALNLLEAVHAKWTFLLKGISFEDFEKKFTHPETGKEISLGKNLALYVWHCNHHYAHIENLMKREGWV